MQVTRNLLFTPSSCWQALSAKLFSTNQMFSMAFNTGLGVSFWNSYTNNYNSPRQMSVYVRDLVNHVVPSASNKDGSMRQWSTNNAFYLNAGAGPVTLTKPWPGTMWSGSPPFATILNPSGNVNSCFITAFWPSGFLNARLKLLVGLSFRPGIRFDLFRRSSTPLTAPALTSSTRETTSPALPQLPGMILANDQLYAGIHSGRPQRD